MISYTSRGPCFTVVTPDLERNQMCWTRYLALPRKCPTSPQTMSQGGATMVQRYYPVALASVTLKVAGSNPAQNAKIRNNNPRDQTLPTKPQYTGLRTRNHLTLVFGPIPLDTSLRTNPA